MTVFDDLWNYFTSSPGSSGYQGGPTGKFNDYSDTLANQHGLFIDIVAMHAQARVQFKAFLTTFQDSFDTGLDVTTFVGHAEPVRKMRSVDRQMQIGLDIPASNAYQAKRNLHDVSKLVRMIYPLADQHKVLGVDRAHVKAGGDPLFKVKFKNLITGPTQNPRGNALEDGLTGYIGNINYSFDLPSGFFNEEGDTGFIYPQLINLSFSFFPFNEKLPIWTQVYDDGPTGKSIKFTRPNHPYAWTAEGTSMLDSWATTSESKVSRSNAAQLGQALGDPSGGPGHGPAL